MAKKQPEQLYGVFLGSRWGTTTDRKQAFKAVMGVEDAEIRAMPLPPVGERTGWDSPTFRAMSDRIYPTPAGPVTPVAINYLHLHGERHAESERSIGGIPSSR